MYQRHKTLRIKKNYYENKAWDEGTIVCGIDEVGRGSLAGPVVTAAVIVPPYTRFPLLKDSKLLSRQQLQEGYTWIIKHCSYALGIMHHRFIDQKNIYHATLHAMRRSLYQLLAQESRLGLVLVDAMPLRSNTLQVINAPRGESWSISIAAASIYAKVTRDLLMERLDTVVPGYAFAQHKGYTTKRHTELLRTQAHSFIHRKTYKITPFTWTGYYEQQQTLC